MERDRHPAYVAGGAATVSGMPKPGTTPVCLDPQRELLQLGDELVETLHEDGQQLGLGGLVRVGAIVIRPSWKILTRLRM